MFPINLQIYSIDNEEYLFIFPIVLRDHSAGFLGNLAFGKRKEITFF